jgi:hypothetical protein
MKLLFGIFSEDMSYPGSMLSRLAKDHGWDVNLVFFANGASDDETLTRIQEFAPDMVALSIKTFERDTSFQVARLAKKFGAIVIAGGPHVTASPEDLKSSGFFHGIVTGDGAGVLAGILDNYRSLDGQIIKGSREEDLSVYARRFFSPTQEERLRSTRIIDTISAIGCPFRCTYCGATQKVIPIPLEAVVDEIQAAKECYGVEMVNFWDDTFTFSRKRVREYRELMVSRGLDIQHNVTTSVATFDEGMADELVSLGVEDISFGLETASPKLLKFINKKIRMKDVHRAVRICQEKGLPFKINLMFGLPTQDREDYELTLKFVEEYKPDNINCFMFVVLPGTPLFDYCIANDHMPSNWSFEDYLSIDHTLGIRDTPGILRNVDYDIALEYMGLIRELDNQHKDETILRVARQADNYFWVVLGSGYYFDWVLERLSRHQWKNLIGYVNIAEEEFPNRSFNISIPEFHFAADGLQPSTVITTSHHGRYFHRAIAPMLSNRFNFSGKILSFATQQAVAS